MNIALQGLELNKIYNSELIFSKFLPSFIVDSFFLKIFYKITHNLENAKLLLNLQFDSEIPIECERCGQRYDQNFQHESFIAICQNDAEADAIMADFDPVIAINNEIDLAHIVLDEIILFCPRKHTSC